MRLNRSLCFAIFSVLFKADDSLVDITPMRKKALLAAAEVAAHEHEKDFTLNLRWGEFLFEYARRAYNFDAPTILQQAASKLTLAKTLGKNYYSQPYLMLAKVALKSGDRAQGIALLKECRDAFTTEYYEYDLSGVWKDKDFEGIAPEDLA